MIVEMIPSPLLFLDLEQCDPGLPWGDYEKESPGTRVSRISINGFTVKFPDGSYKVFGFEHASLEYLMSMADYIENLKNNKYSKNIKI